MFPQFTTEANRVISKILPAIFTLFTLIALISACQAQNIGISDRASIINGNCDIINSLDLVNACEQKRSTDIAQRSLEISIKQFHISRVGIYALIPTLLITIAGTLLSAISTHATRKQVLLSRESLIADQRAWIKTDLIIDSDYKFYQTGSEVRVKAHIQNIGKTPAHYIHTRMIMLDSQDDNIREIKDFANECRARNSTSSRLLLPSDSYYRPWGLSISNNKILGDSIYPLVVVCVTYESIFNEVCHQTVTAYILCEGEGDSFIGLIKYNVDLAKERVQVTVTPGGFAD